ncbi:hypothetical protein GGX14DRAFT_395673 [Mycena pura]|uniref:RNase H type-1 domain-containing protein n=1 Tax=Mycena pura TaxID=153505 RepID=A0AAD6VDX4_9AGAR|nr:hypothetical protein GGX14DRAFT_395673 [Mycena pura]
MDPEGRWAKRDTPINFRWHTADMLNFDGNAMWYVLEALVAGNPFRSLPFWIRALIMGVYNGVRCRSGPKWDIRRLQPLREDEENTPDSEGAVIPFRRPPQITKMSQGLRVLTKFLGAPPPARTPPGQRSRRRGNDPPVPETARVYIHGAVLAHRNTHRRAGAGVAFTDGKSTNVSLRLPGDWNQDSQSAEILAALVAVRAVRDDADLTLSISTQDYIKTSMNTHLHKWENKGWVGVKDRLPLQCLAAEIRARTGKTSFGVISVSVDDNMRAAKHLAIAGCESSTVAKIDLTAPLGYSSQGIALVGTRQKVFYRAIRFWTRG